MFNNQDAGDVSGLEEVFRSQEFVRASGTGADESGGVGLSVRRGEGIFGTRFGRRPVAAPVVRTGDDAESSRTPDALWPPVAGADGTLASKQPSSVPAASAGAGLGRRAAAADDPSAPAWNRHSSRYWTIASVSALVALVVAGVTAGSGQHPRSNVAAQGRHGRSRPGGGLNTSGGASTGLAAPGGLLAAAAANGSAVTSSVANQGGRPGSGNAPGGHVTLIGPATFTGAPGSPPVPSGGAPSRGGGAAGSPPSGGTNPAAPVASTVGSALGSAGSSVTTLASQIGTSVPAAASTTSAVNNVINTVDQTVSASTG
jgi:hypothetical protein